MLDISRRRGILVVVILCNTRGGMSVYTFRPAEQIRKWLSRKPNRSSVINDALQRYKDGEPLPQDVLERLDEFGVTLDEIRVRLSSLETKFSK